MGCRSNYVRVWYGRRMRTSSDEPGKVRHVNQIERGHLVGNLAHAGEVNSARVGAASADDQLRALLYGELFQFVVVDGFRFFRDPIRNDLVRLAGKIQAMPVRPVAALR